MRIMTRGDRIVFSLVIIFSALLYFLFTFLTFAAKPKTVEISVDGNHYASYRLADIKEKKVLNVETKHGYNVLEITPHGVRVVDASCPDKLDVKSGMITKVNQMIICVPNHLSVMLVGAEEKKIDKVTY